MLSQSAIVNSVGFNSLVISNQLVLNLWKDQKYVEIYPKSLMLLV